MAISAIAASLLSCKLEKRGFPENWPLTCHNGVKYWPRIKICTTNREYSLRAIDWSLLWSVTTFTFETLGGHINTLPPAKLHYENALPGRGLIWLAFFWHHLRQLYVSFNNPMGIGNCLCGLWVPIEIRKIHTIWKGHPCVCPITPGSRMYDIQHKQSWCQLTSDLRLKFGLDIMESNCTSFDAP